MALGTPWITTESFMQNSLIWKPQNEIQVEEAAPEGIIAYIDVMGLCQQLIHLQLYLHQNEVIDAANILEQDRYQIMDASRRAHNNAPVPSYQLQMDCNTVYSLCFLCTNLST